MQVVRWTFLHQINALYGLKQQRFTADVMDSWTSHHNDRQHMSKNLGNNYKINLIAKHTTLTTIQQFFNRKNETSLHLVLKFVQFTAAQ